MNIKFIPLYFLIAIISACSDKPAETATTVNLPELETITLTLSKTDREVKFDGVIEAINQATVSAQTSGRVTNLPVDVGDFVKKGDLIIQLTDTEQKARAASAQAKSNEAKAQYERMKDMLSKKLAAQADFDKAESAFKSADANLREANEALAHTAIYAPYAGIVVERMIKVGETVAPGTPLMTGLSLESLRAQVDIPQEHIGPVREFKKARVLLAHGKTLEISDIRIPPSADAQSHSFKVLVNLPSGYHNLYPGTLIKIAFVIGETENLLVPDSAISQRGEVSGVYVLNNNKLELRMVNLGTKTADNRYPILAGLQAGEQIVADPIAAANAYKNVSPISSQRSN